MAKIFDDRLNRESRGLRVVRLVIITAAVMHFTLAALSGYRAFVQVSALGIRVPSDTVGPGSIIETEVVTSGRNPVTLVIEAIQGGRVSRLTEQQLPENRNRFYDPRSLRATVRTRITALPAGLTPGTILLRARATGRSQFLRIPPPTIAARPVTLVSHAVAEPQPSESEDSDTLCIAARVGLPCRL